MPVIRLKALLMTNLHFSTTHSMHFIANGRRSERSETIGFWLEVDHFPVRCKEVAVLYSNNSLGYVTNPFQLICIKLTSNLLFHNAI